MARDVVERLRSDAEASRLSQYALPRAQFLDLVAVVEAAKAVSDAENIEAETLKDARTLCALDDALARLYAGSSGDA